MELDPNYYKQNYGSVNSYLSEKRLIRQMGDNPTDYQRLQRYRLIDAKRNPQEKKITDFMR